MDATADYDRFHSQKLLETLRNGELLGDLKSVQSPTTTPSLSPTVILVEGKTPSPTQSPTVKPTGAPTKSDITTGPITMAEVEQHNTSDDCWVAFHGKVYDVSSYASLHPGGAFFITRNCGLDGTSDYDRFHTQKLLVDIESKMKGPLQEGTPTPTSEPTVGSTPSPTKAPAAAPTQGPITSKPSPAPTCLLYTSPSPRDQRGSRMPSSA